MEMDARILGVTIVMWGVCVAAVWMPFAGEGFPLFTKIAITVLALPIIYFIVYRMGGQ